MKRENEMIERNFRAPESDRAAALVLCATIILMCLGGFCLLIHLPSMVRWLAFGIGELWR